MTEPRPRMGAQPSLDGLRAIAVVAVILYHAGFTWMPGGFLGVEVFFVVSGYLITTLLIEELGATRRISLSKFWQRRARRLLPALGVTIVAVALWTWLAGTTEQATQLRSDVPGAVFYVSNWKQIFETVPYYANTSPPLLRHLWSLAVEEQWYLLWPLAFILIVRATRDHRRIAAWLFGAAVASWVLSAAVTARGLDRPLHLFNRDLDRANVLYLATVTRVGGLLVGAALAFAWRPWQHRWAQRRLGPEVLGTAALTVLSITFFTVHLREASTFTIGLPLIAIFSAIAIALAVHPGATQFRALVGAKPLAAVGRRSYGLYLWHWPVFVFAEATSGGIARFVLASIVAIALAEASYRYVETPARQGAIGRLIARARAERRPGRVLVPAGAAACLVAVLAVHFASAPTFDRAVGGDAEFQLPPSGTGNSAPTTAASSGPPTKPTGSTSSTAPSSSGPTSTVANAPLPRRLAIVGDSTAHALAVNLPKGIGSTFSITDGSIQGCGVFSSGTGISSRGFKRSFAGCGDVAQKWARSAGDADAQVALITIGAWEVLDLQFDGRVVKFASAEFDALFDHDLQAAIDAISATGARVALLEVPCMRPVDAPGAGTPPLPERADDSRAQHLSDLLRAAAARNPATTTFVAGPQAWCHDESIATDTAYRWDGVHVYKPGANLVYTTVAPALLAIHVDP